jgi:protein TonB
MTTLHQTSCVRRLPGLGAVAVLHVALIMALLNGLGTGLIPREPTHTVARILPPPAPLLPEPPPLQAPRMAPPDLAVQPVPMPMIPTDPVATAVPPSAAAARPGVPARPVARTAPVAPSEAGSFSPLHIVGGAPAPAYPDSYEGLQAAGRVTVDCVIQIDGTPADCRIVAQHGGPAFANETLRWLNGPHHPVYQAAVRNGQKRAEEHQWVVSFQPE